MFIENNAIKINSKIQIKARLRVGTDNNGIPIIREWWEITDLIAYLPAWDKEDILKSRDYAIITPRDSFYPSWWYRPYNGTNKLTKARGILDIYPNDYHQLKAEISALRQEIGRDFAAISKSGLFYNWKNFKI